MKTFEQGKAISGWQFTLFRVVFGGYLVWHFLTLIPFAGELFGCGGLISDPGLNPTAGLFPSPYGWPLGVGLCTGLIGFLAVCALLFTGGVGRPWMAVVLWFGWSALFHRNNLIANPSIPYVGLLLLLCAIIPSGDPLSRGGGQERWAMPLWVWRCAWVLLAVGYTFSGWTKLASPSWIDGSAMRYLLENPLARDGWARDLMLALPDGMLPGMTWLTLLAELLFLPLALWRKTRPWIWLLLVGMHFGIMAVVDFADLSLGMLMIHLFTFDPDWLPFRRKGEVLLAFDGDCLMCSGFIRFLAGEDRGQVLRFTTLQGGRGREMERGSAGESMGSLIVSSNGRLLSKSSAVMELLDGLGGFWRLLAWAGRRLPVAMRDWIYDEVARRRIRQPNACGLPPDEVRVRLID